MQNVKDTFYVAMLSRLSALNPERTIVVRGVTRPGILVDENELASASVTTDAFRMRWTGAKVVGEGPLPLVALECEVRYATDGSPANAAMDRGRLLAAMDGELLSALNAEPRTIPKMNYSRASLGVAPIAMGTNLFWGEPLFGVVSAVDERLERTATVQVFAYQEAGEL